MEKIKLFLESPKGKNILTSLIVILVGLGSFGLGRLSKDTKSSTIKIEYGNQAANAINSTETSSYTPNSAQNYPNYATKTVKATKSSNVSNSIGKAFFASKIGHKYYSIGCSGGKTIKQENRIYFNTEIEATNAGYEKSASCK